MLIHEAAYRDALQLLEDGQWPEAAAKLAALTPGTTDLRFYAAHGLCLQKLGHWSKSIQLFEMAISLQPSYCEADWRNMLAASYLKDGRTQSAIEQWSIVAAMEAAYPSHDAPIDEAKRMLKVHGG